VINAILRVAVRVVRLLLAPRALDRVGVFFLLFLRILPFSVIILRSPLIHRRSRRSRPRTKLRSRVKIHTKLCKVFLAVLWTVMAKQLSLFIPFPGLCLSCDQSSSVGDGEVGEKRRVCVATPFWGWVVGVWICAVLWEVLLAVSWIVVAEEFSLLVFFLSWEERGDRGGAKGKGEGGAGE
jgi:hypothetical protein